MRSLGGIGQKHRSSTRKEFVFCVRCDQQSYAFSGIALSTVLIKYINGMLNYLRSKKGKELWLLCVRSSYIWPFAALRI
jgi:hypothetical protein